MKKRWMASMLFISFLFLSTNIVLAKQLDTDRKAQAYFDRANAHAQKGEIDLAIANYTKVIDLKPTPQLYFAAVQFRGGKYLIKKDYDKAILDFTKGIEGDPDPKEVEINLLFRARSYFSRIHPSDGKKESEKSRYYDLAMDDVNKVIRKNPNSADAFQLRSMMYAAKKDFDKSWADVHKTQALSTFFVLGAPFDEAYLDRLRKDSGRQK